MPECTMCLFETLLQAAVLPEGSSTANVTFRRRRLATRWDSSSLETGGQLSKLWPPFWVP